jgi:hypothetical protein
MAVTQQIKYIYVCDNCGRQSDIATAKNEYAEIALKQPDGEVVLGVTRENGLADICEFCYEAVNMALEERKLEQADENDSNANVPNQP